MTAHEKLYQDHCSDSSSISCRHHSFRCSDFGYCHAGYFTQGDHCTERYARTAEANRSELHTLETCGYSGDFVILDMTDNVLYANTVSEDKLSLEKAMQKRYPYQYLKNDSGIWDA